MKAISSADECRALIKENGERLGKCDSNCLLLGGEMLAAIPKGRLFYRSFSDGLVLYRDEGDYYEAVYYWKKDRPFEDLRADKDVSIVELNAGNRRDTYLAELEVKLSVVGFQFFKKTLQLELSVPDAWAALQNEYAERLARAQTDGFQLADPVPSESAAAVVSLWVDELDAMDVPLSNREDLLAGASGHSASFVATDGSVAAAYWWQISGAAAEGRHIVTNPAFGRKGLASLLLLHAIGQLHANGIRRMTTFIKDDNIPSLQLHKKIGFAENGRSAIQYLLQKQHHSLAIGKE